MLCVTFGVCTVLSRKLSISPTSSDKELDKQLTSNIAFLVM